jgi:hypothetical protein
MSNARGAARTASSPRLFIQEDALHVARMCKFFAPSWRDQWGAAP